MNEKAVDNIVGKTPEFALRGHMEALAGAWLDSKGEWTHLQEADAYTERCLKVMVGLGIAEAGEAYPKDNGQPLNVYRLKCVA